MQYLLGWIQRLDDQVKGYDKTFDELFQTWSQHPIIKANSPNESQKPETRELVTTKVAKRCET
jgi:hypothetical protein